MFTQTQSTKIVITTIFFFIIICCVQSQSVRNAKVENITIGGQVLDNNNEPLEFASAILLRYPDSVVVTGTITNLKGLYKFDNIQVGKYLIQIQFIGYKTVVLPAINITGLNQTIGLEPVRLIPTANELKEVEVTGYKDNVNSQLDKKVINVQKDLDAASGNAIDILEKSPAVSVDADKNISIRGRSDVTVLINGKPSALTGSDALSAISASLIDKIEIITNPSAKYEAQGIAGIINIVTKKGKVDGLEGLAGISAGMDDKYKAEVNFNYQKGIFDFIFQAKYDDFTYLAQSTRNRIIRDTINNLYKDYFNRKQFNIDDALKAGIGIKLPKFSAGVDAKAGYWFFGKQKIGYQNTWSEPGTIANCTNTNFHSDVQWKYLDFTGYMNFVFNKPNHKLENIIFYSSGKSFNNYESDMWIADEYLESIGNPVKTRTGENGNKDELRIQSDYTLPINDHITLESGIQANISNERENYFSQNCDTLTNRWTDNDSSQYIANVKNNIYGVYLNIKGKSEKFEYQAGLRAEYNDRDIEINTNMPNYILQKLQLFPSASAGYAISETKKLYFSFSRRVNRPVPWLLLPFVQVNDNYNSTVGNPKLKSEINNNFEIGIEQHWKNLQFALCGFSRAINQGIWQVYYRENRDNFRYTYINSDQQLMNGMDLHMSQTFWKVLEINLSASLFTNSIKGHLNDSAIFLGIVANNNNKAFHDKSFSWNTNATINLKITPTTRVQWFANYQGPMAYPEGRNLSRYFVNIALQQDLLRKKLKLNLKVDDIFNTTRYSGEVFESENYYVKYVSWRKRFLLLSISYNFNNYKAEGKKNIEIEKGGF